ncbi:response regulator [Marivirga salinae]|uniref:Response regulator n=1 Tax=Marivirga salinarum TaxID=3059078 RepID=A0AA49GAM5_9BACT|nr:response regulator [Marivirga sp. BDSF4-3]WKK74114.1 response regulator [Marivirga sp. BDSF4-3]
MAIFKNIFIIDDDELFLIVSKEIIQDEGFAEHIHNFEDGREVLEYLKSANREDIPEILFLDINMPMMDGWELMDALQELSIVDKMRIYITSSSINPVDLDKADKNPYIKGFISKPISPDKLKKIASDKK